MRTPTVETLKQCIAEYEQELETPLKPLLTEVVSSLRKDLQTLEMLTREFEAFGLGFTVKHGKREAWGAIFPDASTPGAYRWQEFGLDGFIAHSTHPTPQLCLGDLVDSGFTTPDQGALERLSGTARWRKGNAITAIIQACNSGLLSWQQANQRCQDIQDAFDKEVA